MHVVEIFYKGQLALKLFLTNHIKKGLVENNVANYEIVLPKYENKNIYI